MSAEEEEEKILQEYVDEQERPTIEFNEAECKMCGSPLQYHPDELQPKYCSACRETVGYIESLQKRCY